MKLCIVDELSGSPQGMHRSFALLRMTTLISHANLRDSKPPYCVTVAW